MMRNEEKVIEAIIESEMKKYGIEMKKPCVK